MLRKILAIICFLGMAASALADSGKLEAYPSPSQNGTIARRVFTDEHGRPIREIYYRAGFPQKEPKDDSGYSPSLINLYSYDKDGRKEWMGVYSPEYILQRASESFDDSSGKQKMWQWRDADGIVRYQMRNACALDFDDTGTRLIGICGEAPSDLDLFSGWGKKFDGLACGIGLNRDKGKLEDIRFQVTIRNVTTSALKFNNCLDRAELKVELRGSSGQLIRQDPTRLKKLREMRSGTKIGRSEIGPNDCATFGIYSLKEWDRHLPAGLYTLTVRRRTDGKEFSLSSKPVQLEILAEEPQKP